MSVLSNFINANAHYNRGIDAIEHRRYHEAERELTAALRINPRYTLAFINRGKLYQQHLNRAQYAVSDYERALKLDPHDDQTRFRLAKLARATGHYELSARSFYTVALDVGWLDQGPLRRPLREYRHYRYQAATGGFLRALSKLDFH